MGVASDIAGKVAELFPPDDRELVLALIADARLHDGSEPDARCQRCALQASQGSLDRLGYYLDLLATDYRDVIVAGEYESVGGKLVRVRDLGQSFQPAAPSTGPGIRG